MRLIARRHHELHEQDRPSVSHRGGPGRTQGAGGGPSRGTGRPSDIERELEPNRGLLGTEVIPNKDAGCVFCIHAHLLTRHGIVNQENMDLDGLWQDKAYRFLYVFSPVPIAGATGSAGSPLAIR